MSDIKNPAPFYTLKQAAKELNRILKVDYYDSKKLLSIALVYDLKLHAYFSGDISVFVDTNFYFLNKRELGTTIKEITEEIINFEITSGALLELNTYSIEKIYHFGQSDVNNYGLENITNLNANAANQSHFLSYSPLKQKYLKYISEQEIKEIEILGIFPIRNTITKENPTRPRKYSTYRNEDNEDIYHPIITREDIFLTHTQLTRVADGVLAIREANPHDTQKETSNSYKNRKPQGKSRAKEHAQIAAKTLANFLWNQDKDNQIKIKEMAITVHAELYQTEHREQLPNHSVSLKDWIKDIAPEYAREAGRPKEM